MGADDRIESSGDNFYETQQYEDEMHKKFIDSYDDDIFLEALIDRLGRRDTINKVGFESFMKMDFLERAKLMDEFTDAYEHKFEEHGLENLRIHYAKYKVN